MKKIIALLLAATMAFSMVGCMSAEEADQLADAVDTAIAEVEAEEAAEAAPAEEAAAPAAGDITIGYATKSSSSPFWVENIKGAQAAADELGINIVIQGPPQENDVIGQIAVLEDMYNGDPLVAGDVAQNPANMGYLSVMTAYNALVGNDYESYVDTGATLVSPANLDEYCASMGYSFG